MNGCVLDARPHFSNEPSGHFLYLFGLGRVIYNSTFRFIVPLSAFCNTLTRISTYTVYKSQSGRFVCRWFDLILPGQFLGFGFSPKSTTMAAKRTAKSLSIRMESLFLGNLCFVKCSDLNASTCRNPTLYVRFAQQDFQSQNHHLRL